ncbi:MAG TPA: cobalamin-binding protein [Deltaproteobacteria bacterium]|nr:cobalamin-binding protein [Deltaproteobacteria bacterium]
MADLAQIALLVQEGKHEEVAKLVKQALEEGVPASEILEQGLIAGMNVVGEKFKKLEIFVPQVLLSARAMKAGMEVLRPVLAQKKVKATGKVVLGTVRGDQHDIGKNLVGMMLEGAGFEVFDLGVNVPESKFVEAAKEKNADIVGMSALLTTTMPYMKTTIEALRANGLKVKVLVGGAPVTQKFADEIGADAYGANAAEAVDKAKELLGIQ